MPTAVSTSSTGDILTHPGLSACGMKGALFFRLGPKDLVRLPETSQIFTLPLRRAVAFDPVSGAFASSQAVCAGALLPPGYTVTHSPAYIESGRPRPLPLFSYAAVADMGDELYAAAVRTDRDIRHDSRYIDMAAVKRRVRAFRKGLPRNRLVRQLGMCALDYGCPNAQNFFLGRFECPLPTSPSCNASCAGCISLERSGSCVKQSRINFVPEPEEISEIAIMHIEAVPKAIVSFGQGCEGEPLLRPGLIERSIRLIRRSTGRGTIHMNTNGSKPREISRLIAAGLDSVRVSTNSMREAYYTRYYRPRGYSFRDVLRSIDAAKRLGAFVSLNYLTMPGFTDSGPEVAALRKAIRRHGIDMVQWRNLNFDPLGYFRAIDARVDRGDMVGVREEIAALKREFPKLRMGYFNPATLPLTASPRR